MHAHPALQVIVNLSNATSPTIVGYMYICCTVVVPVWGLPEQHSQSYIWSSVADRDRQPTGNHLHLYVPFDQLARPVAYTKNIHSIHSNQTYIHFLHQSRLKHYKVYNYM